MITAIIKSYLTVLLSVGMGSLLIFILGMYLIIKFLSVSKRKPSEFTMKITSNDINAIAGEDAITTQLDLARAYIETGRKQLAKSILEYAAKHGSKLQQQEAQRLLGLV